MNPFDSFFLYPLLNPWASLLCKDNSWPGLRPDASTSPSPHQASSPVLPHELSGPKLPMSDSFTSLLAVKTESNCQTSGTSVSLWTRLPFHLSRRQTGCGSLCQLPDGLVPPGGSGQSVLVLDSGLPKEKKKPCAPVAGSLFVFSLWRVGSWPYWDFVSPV